MTEAPTRTASTRSRKIKALLAGGLVLGVGAAVTLAAWTDQEWAEGIFGAGSFNIEGSTSGEEGSFRDNNPDGTGPASLEFELPTSTNLYPGAEVAAPFVVRLDAETTYNASLELTEASATGDNSEALTYGIVRVPSAADCTADASGTEIVEAGTALSSAPDMDAITLEAGEGTAGDPVTLCFQVTADENLQQNQSTTANWQFVGTSVE
ncbi:SipW-dependent-type signal peptide-containing protein [Brevibacterium yomogidense]|uniref:SipW-cognate class signal peptide n=1 Tax=Brevibacterium yomogidense TaxID=946573 RepID=A0A1X6X2E3_9MICO|nr:SipW-dependent-type signal peptide-containing protein [Brevibacterium yomogidense]SLM92717.1 hypothetical protein FM105_03265 [Brevibacterium yomogidense]